MTKQEQIQELADRLQELLYMVDIFANELSPEEIELLEDSKEELENKISYGENAICLINAVGGNYDPMEDKYKLKTLNKLQELIKIRKNYLKDLTEKKNNKNSKSKNEFIQELKKMGYFNE